MMTEENKSKLPEGYDIRYTESDDAPHLKRWLTDPSVDRWFPMCDEVEINDAVHRWIYFAQYRCSLTASVNGTPIGIATLYLQPYKKLAHQCEFGIIIDENYRNKGIGQDLLRNLIHLAKNTFKIEVLHLMVYADNPAKRLYERMGFKEFGYQSRWIKDGDDDVGRTFMEKYLD